MDRYTRLDKLGEGTYGIVYKARDNKTGDLVALKMMKIPGDDGIPATTLREMSIPKSISHPNILKLLDVISEPGSLTMVSECMDIDLRRYLLFRRSKPFDPDLLCSYVFQLLCGIFVLHTHRIIHRDLKPANLLLNSAGLLKISDFGLSRYVTLPHRQYSPNVVSLWYRAPELLFGQHVYDFAIDIWSAGSIVAEMVKGAALFTGDSEIEQLDRIFSVLGSPTAESLPNFDEYVAAGFALPDRAAVDLAAFLNCADPQLVDLISKMLLFNPKERLSALNALKHPYFDKVARKTREICLPPQLNAAGCS
jgi:serine/threonine protein kinase